MGLGQGISKSIRDSRASFGPTRVHRPRFFTSWIVTRPVETETVVMCVCEYQVYGCLLHAVKSTCAGARNQKNLEGSSRRTKMMVIPKQSYQLASCNTNIIHKNMAFLNRLSKLKLHCANVGIPKLFLPSTFLVLVGFTVPLRSCHKNGLVIL